MVHDVAWEAERLVQYLAGLGLLYESMEEVGAFGELGGDLVDDVGDDGEAPWGEMSVFAERLHYLTGEHSPEEGFGIDPENVLVLPLHAAGELLESHLVAVRVPDGEVFEIVGGEQDVADELGG